MSQRGFRPNEKITRKTLNRALSAPADVNLSGPRVNERRGQTVITDEEEIYIRVTGSATSPLRYAWQEVYHDKSAGGWNNTNRKGSTDSDPAFELNNSTVSAGSTVYTARRSRASGAWTFNKGGGGGGNVDIRSGETVLMILGDYETYKDCPDVPPKPPTTWSDGCMTSRTTTLCVPAYAYAVYSRCGYVWNKIGDTRDFQVWANELNGGSFSAWRRFVIPRWGGDIDPLTGLPDPEAACMGVAFLGTGAGSALTCSCPPCLSSPPEGVQLCFKFRTIVRPDNPMECVTLKNEMDANSAWDKDYVIPLTKVSGYCSATGTSTDGIFSVNIDWQDGSQLECDWGPEVFDPCDPCEHWGRVFSYIDVPGGNEPNCGGAGAWRGEFKARDICNLLCDCGSAAAAPIVGKFCNGCGNAQVPPAIWNVIKEGTIEIACCAT